jgi:hypothetical protein
VLTFENGTPRRATAAHLLEAGLIIRLALVRAAACLHVNFPNKAESNHYGVYQQRLLFWIILFGKVLLPPSH